MVKRTSDFTQSVGGRIGNHRQPIYDPVDPDRIYFSAFGEQPDEDDRLIPFGEEIMDHKTMDIDDSYIEELYVNIGAKLVLPIQDPVPVLATIAKRDRNSQGLPVVEENTNPILDSRIYSLEFPGGRIKEYSINSIHEKLLKHTDKDGWESAYLE